MRKIIWRALADKITNLFYALCLAYGLLIIAAELAAECSLFGDAAWRIPDAEYHLFYLIYFPLLGLWGNHKQADFGYLAFGVLSVYLLLQVKIWFSCIAF